MAVEWYLYAYDGGGSGFVPTGDVLGILRRYPFCFGGKCLDVKLPDGIITIYMDYRAEVISGMMFSRPCASDYLYKMIYDIMKLGNFVLFSPDWKYPIVLSGDVLPELPDGMLEALGMPRVADCFESFACYIYEAHS